MTKQSISQSQKRIQDSLGSLFMPEGSLKGDFLFLKSSTDIGVQRNGGRNGARLAPQSFLSYFKKLNKKPSLEKLSLLEIEVGSEADELADFHASQKSEALRIETALKASPAAGICHLGGGHDHVYPLLSALGKTHKKIIVINIDAHADTRTDTDFHSGTPFRQFATEYQGEFSLYQVGLLEFANSASTLSPLPRGMSKILWKHELAQAEKVQSFFSEIKAKIDTDTVVVFSLDADALSGAEMPGVSAVNGDGLSRAELSKIWSLYQSLGFSHRPVLGFYELNPVYDTLSMMSMRTLATFLFETF
jgi:formiminoglutamase